MLALCDFLNIMSTNCELVVLDEEYFKELISGYNYEIELPNYLRYAPVVHFTPGIVTKIFIKEPKF